MKSFAYVEIDKWDDERHNLVPLIDGDLLDFEIENVGTPEGWDEYLVKLSPGYYEIEFGYHMESECWEHPAEYCVIDDFISAKKSLRARWEGMKKFYIDPVWFQVSSVFRKMWRIEYLYGGVGCTSPEMYLPVAIWYRIFNVKKFAYWGEGYDASLTRR